MKILRFFFWWILFWFAWSTGWAAYEIARQKWLWALSFIAIAAINVALLKQNLRYQRRERGWR